MKMCWNNIENIKLTKNGNFRNTVKKKTYYLRVCKYCGEEFLGEYKISIYCCISCSNKDREHTNETKEKISKSRKGIYIGENAYWYNKKFSKEHKRKLSESKANTTDGIFWEGGYKEKDIPTYNTYAPQIEWCEEVRRNKEDPNILEVRCFKCGKWFIPRLNTVSNRIQHLKGNEKFKCENLFYCSQKCKNSCSLYKMKVDDLILRDEIRSGVFNISKFKLYKREVVNLSNRIFKKFPEEIINSNKERGRNKYHLDHIYSIKEGFLNDIPEYVISSPINLRMIPESDNISKGCKCDMNKSELISKFNNFITTKNGNIFIELAQQYSDKMELN